VKIAIDARVVQDRFPGIGRYVFRLAEALPAAVPGISVLVLHNPNQSDTRFDLTGLARSEAISLRAVTGGLRSLRGQWSVRRALSHEAVDLYHATYWIGAYLPGVPTLLTLYDLIGLDPAGGLPAAKRLLLRALVRLALARADHVATLSSDSRRGLIAAGGTPQRITITPLAADPGLRPASRAAVAALRERFALPRHYVLYVGTNKPHKNLITLVEAWGRLGPRLGGSWSLVIAGSWDRRFNAPKGVGQVSIPGGGVRCLGPVPEADLPALYSGATVFAFPSLAEGFGLPPLEAMACGAPVVVSDASSLPEIVGDAGMVVAAQDPGAWAAALGAVAADPALGRRLSRQGIARAREFSWQETARLTAAAYRAAVEARRRL